MRKLLWLASASIMLAACAAPPPDGSGTAAASQPATPAGREATEPARVVFFGDSITALWRNAMPAFFAQHGHIDRGISGQTTVQMLERFDRDVIEVKPNVVVILGGTNDIAGSDPPYDDAPIRANLRAMTERAQSHGIRVVLASLLPARDFPWRHGLDPAPKIVALNTWIKAKKTLYSLGETPLPRFINRPVMPEDKDRYQTIFAKNEGAVAAPTAGLHFSRELMKRLEIKGVNFAYVTLHVGLGNFRSVDVEDLTKHKMDSEQIWIYDEACNMINQAKLDHQNVCAVGTTVMRTIESSVSTDGMLKPFEGWTNKFIFPPYEFSVANRMITNFHLPLSTLLMMVAAFAGYDFLMEAYHVALKNDYRFGTMEMPASVPRMCRPPSLITASCSAAHVGLGLFQDRLVFLVGRFRIGLEPLLCQCLAVAAQQDVGTTAGHVGGDGDGLLAAGLGDDLGLFFVLLGVEYGVGDTLALEQFRQHLGFLDGDRAHQAGLTDGVVFLDILDDRVELLHLGLVDHVREVGAQQRAVGGDHHHVQLVDLVELLGLGRQAVHESAVARQPRNPPCAPGLRRSGPVSRPRRLPSR